VKLSQDGLDLIKGFEGCRLKSYQDSVGIWTIGFGSTMGICEGMEITHEQAEQKLWADVRGAEKCVNAGVAVPLTQNEFDALVSFVFNVGCKAFLGSTLLRCLNGGDYDRAAAEFGRWDKARGKVLAGLTARRAAERERFEKA
jgi:lysozyme